MNVCLLVNLCRSNPSIKKPPVIFSSFICLLFIHIRTLHSSRPTPILSAFRRGEILTKPLPISIRLCVPKRQSTFYCLSEGPRSGRTFRSIFRKLPYGRPCFESLVDHAATNPLLPLSQQSYIFYPQTPAPAPSSGFCLGGSLAAASAFGWLAL
ncbi:hypothetical protein BKA70DRAFT_642638 [Coprinopsis sp. MPI-PUGE-AT-0042]|nr:hypothetical protein BKA70DRAFT_642638 [Coprinopsis sp. MPI-PUGE-AT-0042]